MVQGQPLLNDFPSRFFSFDILVITRSSLELATDLHKAHSAHFHKFPRLNVVSSSGNCGILLDPLSFLSTVSPEPATPDKANRSDVWTSSSPSNARRRSSEVES